MSKLRLEVDPSDNINELACQATRIATHIGVDVAFEFDGKQFTAKPGMNSESLITESRAEAIPVIPSAPKPDKPKAPKTKKADQAATESNTPPADTEGKV